VALEKLREMDVDPLGRDFPMAVARSRRVREIVARIVFRWYAATTGGGDERVARQSPETLARTFRSLIASRPVYYLWRKPARARRRLVPHPSYSKSSHPEIHPSNTRRERDVECAPDGRPAAGGPRTRPEANDGAKAGDGKQSVEDCRAKRGRKGATVTLNEDRSKHGRQRKVSRKRRHDPRSPSRAKRRRET
jgi:hypothetical protein